MPAMNNVSIKRETLSLRIRPAERDLIDRAAKAKGKNRTDFVLEAARAAAEEALIEQRIIMADPDAYHLSGVSCSSGSGSGSCAECRAA